MDEAVARTAVSSIFFHCAGQDSAWDEADALLSMILPSPGVLQFIVGEGEHCRCKIEDRAI